MLTAGLITVLAVLVITMKLNKDTLQKILGYDIVIDILVTLGLTWLLAGTYSGMMAAIVGGLLFSIALYFIKHSVGYQRLTRHTCQSCGHSQIRWGSKVPKFT